VVNKAAQRFIVRAERRARVVLAAQKDDVPLPCAS
jgi:hypothetical protein